MNASANDQRGESTNAARIEDLVMEALRDEEITVQSLQERFGMSGAQKLLRTAR